MMTNRVISQKQLVYLLVALLALLLVVTLLWSNGSLDGLFGTAVNTSGVVVESSECGARRTDVCVKLDFNHEIVVADTNGIEVTVGYRVQALVNEDLSRATVTNVIDAGGSSQPANANPEVQTGSGDASGLTQNAADGATQVTADETVQDGSQDLTSSEPVGAQSSIIMTHRVLLPIVQNG